MATYEDYTDGNEWSGDDADNVMRQTVMRFADATSRDAALGAGVVEEGMLVYLLDTKTYMGYDGSSWVSYGKLNGWVAYTPAWKDGSGGTSLSIGNGTITGHYFKLGRLVHFKVTLTRGSTTNVGTTGYAFGLPPFTPDGLQVLGPAYFFDSSASAFLTGLTAHSINSTEFVIVNSAGARVSNTVPVVPATSDIINVGGWYMSQ